MTPRESSTSDRVNHCPGAPKKKEDPSKGSLPMETSINQTQTPLVQNAVEIKPTRLFPEGAK